MKKRRKEIALQNNYAKYENIRSVLVYGSEKFCKNPYITIAIPTYKRTNLLKLAIESVLDQVETNCDYEILVVDNETSNNVSDTESLIRAFKSEKILYYQNMENIGMFGNWNRCIELARGDWVAFLHDDDMLTKNYVSKVVNLLKRKKDIGGLVSNFVVISNRFNVENQEITNIHKVKSMVNKLEQEKIMRIYPIDSYIMNGNVYGAPTCGNIFRKSYLLESGGFDEAYFPSSDWHFLLMFNEKKSIYKTRLSFGYYRVLENESLNIDTLEKFVLQSSELRMNEANKSKISKLLYTIFSDELYFQTLVWVKKLDTVSRNSYDQNAKALGYKNRPLRFWVLRKIQSFYWNSKRIFSWFVG